MHTENSDADVSGEVNRRLEDLFADDSDNQMHRISRADPSEDETDPLTDLKAIVLSIDWEITDEIMQRFIDEIQRLIQIFAGDGIVLKLLQIQDSVARYVNTRKAGSHPDAVKLLHSTYGALEKCLGPGIVDRAEKKDLLAREAGRFANLKAQIQASGNKTQPAAEPVATPRRGLATQTLPPADPLLSAIADLKQMIREEFAMLRRDLNSFLDRDA